ncbi:hypothetical protein GCK72_003862 [Caenorhabditis remanei]|uniref:Brr2 N-terminal helicase PWI domain-containing protein n=1 Tax=Caenorhabditis remanei TaxID=31234 RepID=A0A6A5HAP7_CAERE|nr:hypothetical protein GCK72_003862 [Caenorhabditis remanei]KAF1763916.1 hypothetical protein GCK72_003862 [Caenorhabditis remanei]
MDLLDYIERIGDDPPAPPRVASYRQNIRLQMDSEFLEWPNSDAETANFSSGEEPMSLPEVPSTSGGGSILQPITDTLRLYFPDTIETILQNLLEMLCSSRSDNDIQCELIDLLGVELFELAGDVLEKRNKIVYEVKSAELAKVELAKQNKTKVIQKI